MNLTILAITASLLLPADQLDGIVQDTEGRPVADATVHLVDRLDRNGDIEVRTNADGRFALLMNGPITENVQLLVFKPGFGIAIPLGLKGSWNLRVGLESDKEIVVELPRVLPRHMIVVDSHQQPIAGAKLTLQFVADRSGMMVTREKDLLAENLSAVSDGNGKVTLPGFTPGLSVGYVLQTAGSESMAFHLLDGQTPKDIIALSPAGSLVGRIPGEQSGGAAGWKISLRRLPQRSDQPDNVVATETMMAEATSQADGSFEIPHLSVGRYRVSANSPDSSRPTVLSQPVEIIAEQETVLEIPLNTGRRYIGTVRELDTGVPIAGVTLQIDNTPES